MQPTNNVIFQEFTMVAECYATREDQTTASATHAVYPESDSDEREQDRNTALQQIRLDVVAKQDWVIGTFLQQNHSWPSDHNKLVPKYPDVRFWTGGGGKYK